jgi:hypothetical protein
MFLMKPSYLRSSGAVDLNHNRHSGDSKEAAPVAPVTERAAVSETVTNKTESLWEEAFRVLWPLLPKIVLVLFVLALLSCAGPFAGIAAFLAAAWWFFAGGGKMAPSDKPPRKGHNPPKGKNQ